MVLHNRHKVREKFYGKSNAVLRARQQWLRHAKDVIFSEHPPEVKEAYHYYARRNGLDGWLGRVILVIDIRVNLSL